MAQQSRGAEVSSVRLWEGLASGEIRRGRELRSWDPVVLFAGGRFGGGGDGGAAMGSGARCAAASSESGMGDAERGSEEKTRRNCLLRVADADKLPKPLAVEYFDDQDPEELPAGVSLTTAGDPVETTEVTRGAILHPPVDRTDQHFWARLWAGNRIISSVKFSPELSGGVHVLTSGFKRRCGGWKNS